MIHRAYLGSHSGHLSKDKNDPRFERGESVMPLVLEMEVAVAPTSREKEKCGTCNGHGLVGGFVSDGDGGGGYDAEPCPDCATPQAEPAAGEQAGAVAYLMTRPSGFSWPLMPKDVTPAWREVCKADGVTITPLGPLAAPGAAIAAREQCVTCGASEPFTGSCGTSDSDTGALCKRALSKEAPATPQGEPVAFLHIDQKSFLAPWPDYRFTPGIVIKSMPVGTYKLYAALTQPTTVQQVLRIHHEWSIRHIPGYSEHGDERVAYRATIAALNGNGSD